MSYISTTQWRDLETGHVYCEGEPFPFDGSEVDEGRIASLSSSQNKAGFALIKAVEEEVKEKHEATEEAPKKATKGRKKTN